MNKVDNVIEFKRPVIIKPITDLSPGMELIKEHEKEIMHNVQNGVDDALQRLTLQEYVKYLEDHFKRTT